MGGAAGGSVGTKPTMKSLGRYDILDEIGRGAMGVVFRARDPKIDRIVALKCIRPGLFDDQGEASQRFQQEMLALGRLIHPNIVTIFDAGEDSATGSTYIVTEYVEGKSLAQVLKSEEPIAIEEARQIGIQICKALDFAHAKGVIHRDIKPGNILLTDDLKTVKVTDFGIARLDGLAVTQADRLLGTPQYMSPEQCKGDPLDGRSDLFAVGVLLYELLTRTRPFPGESIPAVMQNIVSGDPVPPSVRAPGIPQWLSDAVMRALAKDRSRRFASGQMMVEALSVPESDADTIVLPLPGPIPEPKRFRLWLALTGAALALSVLVYGGWRLLPGDSATVDVSTNPEGAEIQINGEVKGVSPLTLTLPGGSYEVVASKSGYYSRMATIEVPAGEKVPIDLKLAKEEVSQ